MKTSSEKPTIESSVRTKRKAPILDGSVEKQIEYLHWKIIVLRQSIAKYHNMIANLKKELGDEERTVK